MACLYSDGSLVSAARRLLDAARTPAAPSDLAARSGLPLYRVLSALRELAEAGLVTERDGAYAVTEEGLARLEK
jgi:predicted transcriptional regulator